MFLLLLELLVLKSLLLTFLLGLLSWVQLHASFQPRVTWLMPRSNMVASSVREKKYYFFVVVINFIIFIFIIVI